MTQVTALTAIESEIIHAVSGERLLGDTAGIARWVRLSGSEDERRAFTYVADVLRGLGVEPTLHLAPAYISLPEEAELRVGNEGLPAITHSMAASTPPEGLHLTLEPVGNGAAADYAGRGVQGKAILIAGMAMPGKVADAEAAGAAACIFANMDEHVHEMIVSIVWGSPTPKERATLPRIPVISIGRAAADRLQELLDGEETVEVDLQTRVATRWAEIPTLIAQVDGSAEPEKFVLLSGHIDSWHFGAMDNGGANATMLETLRVVLPYRAALRRSLRLAFWSGHSHGRYAGSTWYADTFWEDLHDNCVVHINVDSVGGQNATVLTRANVMAETRPVAAEVIGALTGVEFTGTRFGRAGDQSFQGHGIPSIFMSLSEQPPTGGNASSGFAQLVGGSEAKSGGLGWWWHTPEDTIDKIDPSLLVRDAQIYAAVTYRFLAAKLLPLDLRCSAEDLLMQLRIWQRRAEGRYDLDRALARAEEVAALAHQFQNGLNSIADHVSDDLAQQLNAIIMTAEHALVRLNYVQTDPYGHDSAVSEPPVPLLAPIEQLLATSPGSDTAHELATLIVRRCNQLQHELAGARKALRDGLTVLRLQDT